MLTSFIHELMTSFIPIAGLCVCIYNGRMTDKKYPSPPDGVRVLSNGAGLEVSSGKIRYGPGSFGLDKQRINSGLGSEYNRKRWSAVRSAVQDGIIQAGPPGMTSLPAAIGHAASVLWSEIVLNPDAAARDRRQTMMDVSKMAGAVPGFDISSGTEKGSEVVSLDVLRAIADITRHANGN